MFDDTLHKAVQSQDGSFTAYSTQFEEHYHSTQDGALKESLQKHVIPALTHHKDKDELVILDICFGLGFNTLATLYYMKQNGIKKKITIYSPEFDKELIASLKNFPYPDIFAEFTHIIHAISQSGEYSDDTLHVNVYLGDAREFLSTCKESFDIVYQDAFSPTVNPLLWTKEYFADITKLMRKDALLTTYSMALQTRLALYENGLNIYILESEGCRDSTLAAFQHISIAKEVDMLHKIACNPAVRPLLDNTIL
jgi:tRNA U34 5-methylaminomethyl-2-thiouridine-forming methyltransferase MnmC